MSVVIAVTLLLLLWDIKCLGCQVGHWDLSPEMSVGIVVTCFSRDGSEILDVCGVCLGIRT
jgi:hypothetical protein